jgi:regulator of protease activity HflC (stomatin/prohibitin superfamily)
VGAAGIVSRGVFGLFILIVVANLAGALVIVPAGNRVVVFDKFTGVKQTALGEGMHLIMPFIQEPIRFDVRVQKVDVSASAASKDLQDVSTEVVLNFRPNPDLMPHIYQRYDTNYIDKVITPAIQETMKAVVTTYTAEEVITKREKLKTEVQQHLSAMIQKADMELVETYMTNFSFSEAFSHAIEQKQVAEQLALKAQRDLERVKIEADQKIAQARAEAEGLKMQKEAITPALIELRKVEASIKAIEKWNGVMPTTILGDKGLPFLSMTTK